MEYKGKLKVVARVETLAPVDMETTRDMARLRREPGSRRISGRNLDSEPVSYVCRITYSEQTITIGDRIFVFKNLFPGPDRQMLDAAQHAPGEYRPVGP
jgi:hypothetical protein